MNEENLNKIHTFRYNLSFYYQSTIIYFVVFVLYIIIRGEFVEDSFRLITRDPIIYFFGLIVLVSIVGLLYNLYKKKYIEVSKEGISFISRIGKKSYSRNEIAVIKISRERRAKQAPRLIRIKLKHRRRQLIIRPFDYENQAELVSRIHELKADIEKNHV